MKKIGKSEKTATARWILKAIPLLFVIGAILHFVYGWSGNSTIVGAIAPMNESVWEHAKMLLLPMIAWWWVYYALKHNAESIDKNVWFTSALLALLTALIAMPMLYYFYTQAFGVELLWVDILILLLSIALGQLVGLHYYQHGKGISAGLVMLVLIYLVALFVLFSFYPPQLPIFMDPSSITY